MNNKDKANPRFTDERINFSVPSTRVRAWLWTGLLGVVQSWFLLVSPLVIPAQGQSTDAPTLDFEASSEQNASLTPCPAPKIVLRAIANPGHQEDKENRQGSYEVDLEPVANSKFDQRMKLTIPASVREIEISYPVSQERPSSAQPQTATVEVADAQTSQSASFRPIERQSQVRSSEKNYASLNIPQTRIFDSAGATNEMVAVESQRLQPLVPLKTRNVKVLNPFFHQQRDPQIPQRTGFDMTYQDTGLPKPSSFKPVVAAEIKDSSEENENSDLTPNCKSKTSLSDYQESPGDLPQDCGQAKEDNDQPIRASFSDTSRGFGQ